jgi:hypothetical protein
MFASDCREGDSPSCITHPDPNIHPEMLRFQTPAERDEGFDDADSAYGDDSLIGDDTKTLSTYITDYRYEFGRRYHSYRDGAYWVSQTDQFVLARTSLILPGPE